MNGAARGRHNHARLQRLNAQLNALGMPGVGSLTQARRDHVRAKMRDKLSPPKPVESSQMTMTDANKAKYEAKKAERERRRKEALKAKEQRHAANKALKA